MTVASYRQVLQLAQQLPFKPQIKLAEALMGNARLAVDIPETSEPQPTLSPLRGMTESELRALAEAVVAPDRQQQMQSLLVANRTGALNPEEEATLDNLIDEVDQVALLKARAMYTLQLAQGDSRGN